MWGGAERSIYLGGRKERASTRLNVTVQTAAVAEVSTTSHTNLVDMILFRFDTPS